jgi:8-oxo-dGTP pyrophosphatase MutT (NUDIX family)
VNGPANEIRRLLARHPPAPPTTATAGAAVLILLRPGRTDVETLLIERAERANDPGSGQVGLPGGRAQATDPSLAATCLREVEEEVGLSAQDLAAAPRFVAIESAPVFSLDVAVFAAELGPAATAPSARSPEEVAHVFWLPRGALAHQQRVTRPTPRGPREVDAIVHDRHVVWGFTRRLLFQFFGEGPGTERPPSSVPRSSEPSRTPTSP